MQLYACLNSALIFSMHISHLLHHGLGANDWKISLQAWLYTMWLFLLNLWKLLAAGNIKHLNGKCLQVWDLSWLTDEGGMEKWRERTDGGWGTTSFPSSQRMHCWCSGVEGKWTVNFSMVLQYVVTDTKLCQSLHIATSIREGHVMF